MSLSLKLCNQIIELYNTIVLEFVNNVLDMDYIPDETDYDCVLYSGLSIIHSIFEYSLIHLKSLERAHHYTQTAYVYFIEYTEQIYKNNLSNHFTRNDIIVFVNKKTILSINNTNCNMTSTMDNIISLSDTNDYYNSKDCYDCINSIFNITNQLLCWENLNITTVDRIKICKTYLSKYIYTYNEKKDNIMVLSKSLEYIHSHIQLDYNIYCNLLDELYLYIINRMNIIPSKDNINTEILLKVYIERNDFMKKLKSNNMKEFVRWLYMPLM
jgi:hypothetical protein